MQQATDQADFSPARAGPPPATALVGLGRRIPAALIDGAVLLALLLAESILLIVVFGVKVANDVSTGDIPFFIVGAAIAWLYCAGMESGRRGATLGKRALGLEVLDLDGERPSFARASLRFMARALTFLVGWLWIPLTHRRQALHDLAAGTIVVRSSRRPN